MWSGDLMDIPISMNTAVFGDAGIGDGCWTVRLA